MKSDKYKIIFDTNIIFCNEKDQLDKVFNSSIKEVFDLLESDKVSGVALCLPQLALDERIAQRLFEIREQLEGMNSSLKNLKIFGGIGIKERAFKRDRFQKKLKDNALKTIKEYRVKIIPTIKVDQKILVQRALQRTAPFYARGKVDKGFKDTLIWLSLLDDAQKNQEYNYILLTNDSTGFNQEICGEEFKQRSSAEFWVIRGLQDLKGFLDEKLKLDLKLKELYREVEEEVRSLQGTITTEAGRYINSDKYRIGPYFFKNYWSTAEAFKSKGEGGNFNFYSLSILNISQGLNNEFNIRANISFIIPESKEEDSLYTITDYSHIGLGHDNVVKYNVDLNYRRDPKSIEITSMVEDNTYLRL